LMRIRDGDSSDPGWKKVGSGIRDKHPGSATLPDSRGFYTNLDQRIRTLGFQIRTAQKITGPTDPEHWLPLARGSVLPSKSKNLQGKRKKKCI
jgi:hypothetical protein